MSSAWENLLIEVFVRGLFLAAAGCVIGIAFRRIPHRTRHGLILFFIITLAILPVIVSLVPQWRLPLVEAPFIASKGGNEGAGIALTTFLLAVWLSGASLNLIRLFLANWAVRNLRAGAAPMNDGTVVDELRWELGLGRSVALAFSDELTRPIVCGIWKPMILLPVSASAWSERRMRWVVAHELAHVQRRDLLIQAAVQWICAVYWFNPFVWRLARGLNEDRELAADEMALRVTGSDRAAYARDLLCLVKETRDFTLERNHWVAAAMLGAASSNLEKRIRGLIRNGHPGTSSMITAIVVSGAAAFVLVATCCLVDPVGSNSSASDAEAKLRLSADPFPGD